mmetsp:Transcript_13983/g.45119  ORF Transcript_13983/g.45119 Transcript_13983/m.45119 type:complete len:120 (-) Transcript_13983:149-508(-)
MLDQTALESRGVAAQALSAGLLSPSQLADARAFHEGPSGRRHRLLDSGDPQYTMRFSAAALLVDTGREAFQEAFACWPLRWYFLDGHTVTHIAQPSGGAYDVTQIELWINLQLERATNA